jgi:hypothetical protein
MKEKLKHVAVGLLIFIFALIISSIDSLLDMALDHFMH